MSDRLTELRRQRALAQEQLAWLDREIARESGAAQPPASPAPPTSAPRPMVNTATAETDAEALLAQYKSDPKNLHSDVKRGCFLYFFAAFALVALGLLAFYFLRSRD